MVRWLEPDSVSRWVAEELLSDARTKPVVALTTHQRTGKSLLDPEGLERALGDAAEVVGIETGEATWELADALPSQLEVYGGAARVWWPGLKPDSDPYDHRLYFIHSRSDANAVFADVVQAIRGEEPAREQHQVVTVTVRSIGRNHVELEGGGLSGELRYADGPLDAVVRCLEVGTELPARPVRRLEGNRWAFSTRGLLPHPWQLIQESIREGDVVTARVSEILGNGVTVEILPRTQGFVYWAYVDWDIKQHEFAESVRVGEIVAAKVAEVDLQRRSLKLSIRDAHPSLSSPPRPLPSLVPGGVAFTWPSPTEVAKTEAPEAPQEERGDLQELTNKLEAADADRKELRARIRDLKKELRATGDKLADLARRTGHELDPLSSERAFLAAVRVTYAKMFDEGSRQQHPLQKMRVGSVFLDSVRSLDGVELEKILEVAAQVASGMAHEVEGREVHPLRGGIGGAKAVVRAADKASAWRCALQIKTPSARRLHWWAIPGQAGQTIEFAKVGLHDDVSIPE